MQIIALIRILFGLFLTTFSYLVFSPRSYKSGLSTENTKAKSWCPRLNNHGVTEYYDCCFFMLFEYNKCNIPCQKTSITSVKEEKEWLEWFTGITCMIFLLSHHFMKTVIFVVHRFFCLHFFSVGQTFGTHIFHVLPSNPWSINISVHHYHSAHLHHKTPCQHCPALQTSGISHNFSSHVKCLRLQWPLPRHLLIQ